MPPNAAVPEGPEELRSGPSTGFFVAIASCLMSPLLFGFSLGFTSPSQDTMKGDLDPLPPSDLIIFASHSKMQASMFASVVNLGAMVGAVSAASISDRIGRKWALCLTAVPLGFSYMGLTLLNNWVLLTGLRFVAGLGVGAGSAIAPSYIAEVSTPGLRGGLGAANQLSITIGILVSNIIGAYVFQAGEDGSACQWRHLALCGVAGSVLLTSTALIPESPKFLAKRGRLPQAQAALYKLRSDKARCEAELAELRADGPLLSTEAGQSAVASCGPAEASEASATVFASKYRQVLIAGVGVLVIQQLTGCNAIIFYTETICRQAGMGASAKVGALVIMAMQVLFTFVSCLVMDMLDRKVWLLIACFLMAPSLFLISLFFWSQKHDHDMPAVFAIGGIVVFMIGFSLGWGPIPWLLQPELFPMEVRGQGASLAVLCNWTLSFVVTLGFPPLTAAIGSDLTFFGLGMIMCLAASFVACYLPETRGKTAEQVMQELAQRARRPPRSDARDVSFVTS